MIWCVEQRIARHRRISFCSLSVTIVLVNKVPGMCTTNYDPFSVCAWNCMRRQLCTPHGINLARKFNLSMTFRSWFISRLGCTWCSRLDLFDSKLWHTVCVSGGTLRDTARLLVCLSLHISECMYVMNESCRASCAVTIFSACEWSAHARTRTHAHTHSRCLSIYRALTHDRRTDAPNSVRD